MKALRICSIVLLFSVGFVFMAGCSGGEDIMDEPELTADYFSGEYATQLVRDGATVVFGAIIDITEDEDGNINVAVSEREYVEDPNQPSGYYIADKNIESVYYMSDDTRATFWSESSGSIRAMDSAEFVNAVKEGFGIQEKKLYDIFIIDDCIELLLARNI
jgi:hypothetical protein